MAMCCAIRLARLAAGASSKSGSSQAGRCPERLAVRRLNGIELLLEAAKLLNLRLGVLHLGNGRFAGRARLEASPLARHVRGLDRQAERSANPQGLRDRGQYVAVDAVEREHGVGQLLGGLPLAERAGPGLRELFGREALVPGELREEADARTRAVAERGREGLAFRLEQLVGFLRRLVGSGQAEDVAGVFDHVDGLAEVAGHLRAGQASRGAATASLPSALRWAKTTSRPRRRA